ncbi:hypothetical protein SUGI_0993630 [Cryptomeria japonica]|nr:hypothetical protein SUGI_0993630 [Cryptomeria japonica]
MKEDSPAKVTEDAGSNPGAATVRQRKKRKWDQPAESVISAGFPITGMVSVAGAGALHGFGLPGTVPSLAGVIPSGVMTSAFMSASQISPAVSLVQQNAAAIVQKINQDLATKGLLPQPKIQDELIAREIVINDADPTVRYKLTKRQTQEEIQAKTGAVVITRGKYRPPNGPIENEKPLYLHISSGAHLKDMAERIKAVDLAAAMVEEILRQGRQPQSASTLLCGVPVAGGLATPPFSTADSWPKRATVVLRGRGSGNYEGPLGEELQQPLHLFISSDNAKSLDDAKSLADNLLETVRSECLKSRPPTYQVAVVGSSATPVMLTASVQSSIPSYQVPSYAISSVSVGPYAGVYPQAVMSYTQTNVPNVQSLVSADTLSLSSSIPQPGSVNSVTSMATEINKSSTTRVYNAVPPPQQLMSETVITKANTVKSDVMSELESSALGTDLAVVASSSSNACISLLGNTSSSIATLLNLAGTGVYPQLQQNQQTQSVHISGASSGTSYNGYGGIYPQATPLQQVALALQRPPPPVSVKPGSLISANVPTKAQSSYSNGQIGKQPPKRRKFQELPVASKQPSRDYQNSLQGTEISNTGGISKEPSVKKLQSMPPPKGLPMGPPKGMPPAPLSRSMLPPSSKCIPPPQTVTTESIPKSNIEDSFHHETSLKLVEYGEEDEDDTSTPGTTQENLTPYANGKPFWAP